MLIVCNINCGQPHQFVTFCHGLGWMVDLAHIDFLGLIWYNVNISRRRDAPNGEIPKANLLF